MEAAWPAPALRALTIGLALALLASALPSCATYRGSQLYVSGTEALDAGDGDRAVSELSEAARLVPHASEIQNHLGLAYESTGQPLQAHAAYERALVLDCSNDAARWNRDRLLGAPRTQQTLHTERTEDQDRE